MFKQIFEAAFTQKRRSYHIKDLTGFALSGNLKEAKKSPTNDAPIGFMYTLLIAMALLVSPTNIVLILFVLVWVYGERCVQNRRNAYRLSGKLRIHSGS